MRDNIPPISFVCFSYMIRFEIISESPHSVRLYASNRRINKENQTIIVLHEGQLGQVGCRSKGGHPEPEMRIVIGDHDVTDDFEETVLAEPSADPQGLRSLLYEVTRTSDHFPVNTLYQGQRITCTSSIADTDYQMSDSAILEVHCEFIEIPSSYPHPPKLCSEVMFV